MKQALVTASVVDNNDVFIVGEFETMSTDLPADRLGELIAGVIHKAWSWGFDPVNTKVVVTFK